MPNALAPSFHGNCAFGRLLAQAFFACTALALPSTLKNSREARSSSLVGAPSQLAYDSLQYNRKASFMHPPKGFGLVSAFALLVASASINAIANDQANFKLTFDVG
jgi:hypothetical protein